jgi:hypothetical protein
MGRQAELAGANRVPIITSHSQRIGLGGGLKHTCKSQQRGRAPRRSRRWGPPYKQIGHRDREHREGRSRLELGVADRLGSGMDERKRASNEPVGGDIGAKHPLSDSALDQPPNHSACGLVGAPHLIGAELRGGAADLFVAADLLPASVDQPL